MKGGSEWQCGDSLTSQANLSAPTQAPTRYAEVRNMVEVGDDEEAGNKVLTSLRNVAYYITDRDSSWCLTVLEVVLL